MSRFVKVFWANLRCVTRVFLASLVILGCAAEPAVPALDIRDPLGLMDVIGDLRLLVFPAEGRSCTADGTILPAISDDEGAMFPEAVVDLRFGTTESAMVTLNVGTYVVLIRGRGRDPVTLRENQIVATGCAADVVIEDGETRDITVDLRDVVGMGVCDDGILSPDEQCEVATGPAPCSACRTQPFVAQTTTDGDQTNPGVGWTVGGRLVISFDSDSPLAVRFMMRDEDGQVITAPTALSFDEIVDVGSPIPGAQTTSDAASSSARIGIAFGDFTNAMTEGGDVQVRFFDANRNPAATYALAAPRAMAQTNPRIAMTPDGAALVVFNDGASASGASAALFGAGATTPSAPIAIGTAGSSAPDVAASTAGFVTAFVGAAGIQAQRVGTDGALVDATPISVGAGSEPTVAALGDGRFFVAWNAGGQIMGRAFDAGGAPVGEALTLGSGSRPSAGAGAERFLIAWEAGGTIRARVYDGNGAAARNRENPPTPDAFDVGPGTLPRVAVGGTASQTAAAVVWAGSGDIQTRLFALP